jgi:iron complex outermembrane receptor protein
MPSAATAIPLNMHSQRLPHPIRPLVAASLLVWAAALSASGQDAKPATTTPTDKSTSSNPADQPVVEMEKFNVTGTFAGSLEAAAQEKQNNSAIVEVIAIEDIGKLPDVSIADALSRLTGLTSQRINGRDQQITIRGFSPDFSVGTLEGVEQATTNDNRAVEYDQYPSELIGGVTVYKTGQAGLVGGLAGTVDLQTTSPLSIGNRVVAVSGFYNWTGLKQETPGVKKAGESYTASYVDQFAKGTEGIYLGYAHSENPYTGQQYQSWGYATDPNGNAVIGGLKIYDQAELLKRDSFIAVLESSPNDSIHSKLNFFYSKFDDDQLLDGMQIPAAEWSSAQLQPGYTVSNGVITQYTIKNVQPVVEDLVTHWVDHMESLIWNLDLAQKSDWPVKFQTGWSMAKRKEEVLEDYAGLGFNGGATDPDTMTISNGGGSNPPQIVSATNYANPALFTITDPQGWGTGTFPVTGQEGYLKYFSEKDIADSFKLSTKHDLNLPILKDVEVGVSYSERYKYDAQNPTGYLVNTDGKAQDPLPPIIGTTDLSWIGNIHAIAWDSNGLLDSGKLTLIPNPNPGTYVGDDYKVWEKITRPYFQFDLHGSIGSVPFDGNLGLMADLTQQSSNGLSAGGGTLVSPVSATSNYGDVLPTLNLIFKPTKQDFIRLFIGRQEQRPRMYDMRVSRDYGYNATYANSTTISPWSGSAGNPNLKPWMANSIDLSLEHYFAHGGGYVSVAGFDKKLLSYIYQANTVADFTGYAYTSPLPPVLHQGIVSQYVNGQGGNVSGVEATVQVTSEVLSGGMVKGFGLVANGLVVDSNIQPWGPGNGSAPLPDMSKKSLNLTLYWEGYGFSARVNDHYQSATREYVVQFGVPNPSSVGTPGDGFSVETPYHTIDAQVSYMFKSGVLKGLSFYVEGRNLNNAPLITYNNGIPSEIINYQKYGASYRVGTSYKF